jgi:MYXO-CTERM domain-containing protein
MRTTTMFRGAMFVLACLSFVGVSGLALADVAPPSACDGKDEGDECHTADIENGECLPCTDDEGNEIPNCLSCQEVPENTNTRSGCTITPHTTPAALLGMLVLAAARRRRR